MFIKRPPAKSALYLECTGSMVSSLPGQHWNAPEVKVRPRWQGVSTCFGVCALLCQARRYTGRAAIVMLPLIPVCTGLVPEVKMPMSQCILDTVRTWRQEDVHETQWFLY